MTEQPYQSLVAVITVALASMMLVVIVGGVFIQTKHAVPCSTNLVDRAGIYHELLLVCEVSDFGVN